MKKGDLFRNLLLCFRRIISFTLSGVGAIVCQLAKLHGCRVVGIAGGAEKCNYIQTEYNLDDVIDYRNVSHDLCFCWRKD